MVVKKRRGSVFAGKVSANSHEQRTRTGFGYLNLPDGISSYSSPKSGNVSLDFLPYIVTDRNHPDKNEKIGVALEGELWYKRPFKVHRNVGPNQDAFICPTSIGKKCPICEHRAKRKMEGAGDDELRELSPSNRNLYIVVPLGDKEHEQKPHVWDVSQFLFQKKLNEEIEANPDNEIFPDIEEGLTVKLRFTEESFGANKFGSVSRIDFVSRKNQYEESILEEIPSLDEMLKVLSYKDLQAKFFDMDDEELAEAETEEEEEKPRSRKSAAPHSIRDELPEEDEEEEEEEEEKPKKDKPMSRSKPSRKQEEEEDDEEEDDTPPDDEEEEEEEEEEIPVKERCVACKGTGKNSKGGTCSPCKGTGRKPKAKDPEPEPARKTKSKGPECPKGHVFGKDHDKFKKDCGKCDLWDDCMDASEF
jgi:hypothetical protein